MSIKNILKMNLKHLYLNVSMIVIFIFFDIRYIMHTLMSPKNQNVYRTLNLLVLLFRAKNQNNPKLSLEEKHTIKVTAEHLDKENLTPAIFHNTLTLLDKKGYLLGVTIIEDRAYAEFDKFFDDKTYNEALKEIRKIDTPELMAKFKDSVATYYENRVPANFHFDREGLESDDFSLEQFITETREEMKKPSLFGSEEKPVAIVLLMPFRSIERLLDEMDNGKNFDEVKDSGIWYEKTEQVFHYDEKTLSTKHNRKQYVHYAFKALFSQFESNVIYYAELEEFDHLRDREKELKSYRDALNTFLKKDKRLHEIFSIHNNYLEIHEDYLD